MRKLYLLLIVITLFTISCTRSNESNNGYTQEIGKQLKEAETQGKSDNYQGAFQKSADILTSIKVSEANDSLDQYSLRALQLLYNLCIKDRELKKGIEFLDRQYSDSNSYLRNRCLYELLATTANLYQMNGQCEKALSLAGKYLTLPSLTDPSRAIQTLEMISGVYYYCGNNVSKAISLLEKATAAYHRGGKFKNTGRVLSRLAIYYRETGKYEEAVRINQEAIKFYETQPHSSNSIIAYGELANTFQLLGMYDKALQTNAKAIEYSKEDNFGLGDLYRFRAGIFSDMQQWDSVFYYLNKGEEASAAQKSFKGLFISKLDKIKALINFPDSLHKASLLAGELCKDSANVPDRVQLQLRLYMGHIENQLGKTDKGIALMEDAVETFRQFGMPDNEIEGIDFLMKEYTRKGMKDKLFRNYPNYIALRDSMSRKEKLKITASLNIKYDTERKEREIQLLSTQIELKNKTLVYNICFSISLVLLLIVAIFYILIRRKSQKIIIENNKRTLNNILAKQQELNKKNELLTKELEKALTTNETEAIFKLSSPNILSREDEKEFRQAFQALYPHYLKSLRETYPSLTRTDELFAMLITLKHSTEEISLIMGINRTSVNITRSRMRKKMNLDKQDSLDEVLISFK